VAMLTARDRLIVALDFPEVEAASALVERLGNCVAFYKIGLELVMAGGLRLAHRLSGAGKQVFLDMKLLDIENTVERATRAAAATGATFLTVHAHDTKTLRAAVAGAAGTGLGVLGVTVLTNLDGGDLAEQGIAGAPADLVVHRAKLARAAGCAGIVASGLEAAPVRRWGRMWPSSRPASGRRMERQATRAGWPRRRRPSPPARTTWWLEGR
jgi:orotidine-5'-phosphate decarboxylase